VLVSRYVVIDGRRWRSTDPTLPPDRRQALVDELMSARRAVGAAKRADDAGAERAARSRVHAAKVPPSASAATRGGSASSSGSSTS
jgi:uncharacterized protein